MDGLAKAAGHEDRQTPLKNYCKGLLLPGERKSIEPMAARLDPPNVERMRQSLHHLVARAPWSDEALLEQVRNQVMSAMEKDGSVVAWIVDDTGFSKEGQAFGWGDASILRASRETGKLPGGGQPFGRDLEFESADRISPVAAEGVDRR